MLKTIAAAFVATLLFFVCFLSNLSLLKALPPRCCCCALATHSIHLTSPPAPLPPSTHAVLLSLWSVALVRKISC